MNTPTKSAQIAASPFRNHPGWQVVLQEDTGVPGQMPQLQGLFFETLDEALTAVRLHLVPLKAVPTVPA